MSSEIETFTKVPFNPETDCHSTFNKGPEGGCARVAFNLGSVACVENGACVAVPACEGATGTPRDLLVKTRKELIARTVYIGQSSTGRRSAMPGMGSLERKDRV